MEGWTGASLPVLRPHGSFLFLFQPCGKRGAGGPEPRVTFDRAKVTKTRRGPPRKVQEAPGPLVCPVDQAIGFVSGCHGWTTVLAASKHSASQSLLAHTRSSGWRARQSLVPFRRWKGTHSRVEKEKDRSRVDKVGSVQERSPGRNRAAASREKPTAAAMPPEEAVRPPVKAPSRPCCATAVSTPRAMV